MADAVESKGQAGRCPVCLFSLQLPDSVGTRKEYRCPKCKAAFDAGALLPPLKEPATKAWTPEMATDVKGVSGFAYLLGAVLFVCIVGGVSAYVEKLKGPDFLVTYGIVFASLFVGSTIVRHAWQDLWAISIWAFLVFESIGAVRILFAYPPGVRKFGFMIGMMVLGGILFFVRAKGDGGYGVFGSCAGGCGGFMGCGSGGGGCGGGGCGGCGG